MIGMKKKSRQGQAELVANNSPKLSPIKLSQFSQLSLDELSHIVGGGTPWVN